MKKSDPPIIVEETFNTSRATIWKAITEADQMNEWFFKQITSFQAAKGFSTSFIVALEDLKFTHLWTIVDVKPLEYIKYRWRYQEYSGDSFVTFKLSGEEKNVKLTVSSVVIADFPSNIPQFKRESCIEGWNYFIKESLKNYIHSS